VELKPDNSSHGAYNQRYPVPMDKSKGPTAFPPVSRSNTFTNLYYSVELPPVFKAIFLTSYSPGQLNGFGTEEDQQFAWFKKELEAVRVFQCAVLCCAVLCCAVLCCAVLCCAVLCCVAALSDHRKPTLTPSPPTRRPTAPRRPG